MAKYKGTGVKIEFGDDTGGASLTWTEVVQVKTVNSGPGGGTADEIDSSTHDSVGGFKEFIQGLKDGGSMDFTLAYDPAHASHAALAGVAGLYVSGEERDWKITLTDTGLSTVEFWGYVNQFQVIPQFNDLLIATVGIRIASAITFP